MIVFDLLFILGVILLLTPFAIWVWTNLTKNTEIFGILRLKFILFSFLLCYILLATTIMVIFLIF